MCLILFAYTHSSSVHYILFLYYKYAEPFDSVSLHILFHLLKIHAFIKNASYNSLTSDVNVQRRWRTEIGAARRHGNVLRVTGSYEKSVSRLPYIIAYELRPIAGRERRHPARHPYVAGLAR